MSVVGIPDGFDKEAVDYLGKNGIIVIPQEDCKKMGIEQLLTEADAVAARSATKVADLPDNNKVKIFGRVGSGVDNFKKAEKKINELYIPIVNSPEPNSHSVPELLFSYLLNHVRPVENLFEKSRVLEWDKKKGNRLYGKTIGIVGAGLIGANSSKIAEALGMRILVYDIKPEFSKARGSFVNLDTLLQNSDYVALHVPAGEKPLIAERELNLMKKDAVLINLARGGVADELFVLNALNSKKIARAYFDVFTTEPFENGSPVLRELLRHPNFYATSHIGASTAEGEKEGALIIAQKFVNYLNYGFLSDACNMKINKDLAGLRGLFHRFGMFTKQYFNGNISEVKLSLDGELLTSGDELRTQLETSYLCGLLSDGSYVNPLNVNIAKGHLETKLTNVDEKKDDRVLLHVKANGQEYFFELNYKTGRLTGISNNSNSKDMYKTDLGLAGHIGLFEHDDKTGALSVITTKLALNDIGIQNLDTHPHNGSAITATQTYSEIPQKVLEEYIKTSPHQLAPGKPEINVRDAKYLRLPPADAF